MITIDGSQGEGGGQILRSALALAGVTGTPVRIERIRARRPKAGLQRQHLTAVQAAARVCNGRLEGDVLGSREIVFVPQAPCAGTYAFDIGSAGSTSLVLQTVLPILLVAEGASQVAISGGTHNAMAPPVEFLQDSLLPLLRSVGIAASVVTERHGFYPAGGGAIRAAIQPGPATGPLALLERGKAAGRHAEVLLANLPTHIASREAETLKHQLHWSADEISVRAVAADGPGNALIARLRYAQVTQVVTACGELRTPAEQVAAACAKQVRRLVEATVPVCEHLCDQLLLPLALGAGGSFRTVRPSAHATTNAAVISHFLGDAVAFSQQGDDDWLVTVRPRHPSAGGPTASL
jgi:RNA 3'-terminal phosphate cyclase (ATP)